MQIAQGAEAVITRDGGTVTKERRRKSYRIREIDDRLRAGRTRHEAAMMRKARRAGVKTPQILGESGSEIRMSFVEGEKVRDALEREVSGISEKIGSMVASLHEYGVIHGDLTTSNMILRDGEITLIDFGLSFFSQKTEDKAVDLHLLKEALESTHFTVAERAWRLILKVYRANYTGAAGVIGSMGSLERRGRYTSK